MNALLKTLVFIPAMNEQASIADVITDIQQHIPHADILVVDDGSTDNTAQRAQDAGAIVAQLPYNQGIGAAHQTGFLYAARHNYDLVGQMDADGQHQASDLVALFEAVESGEADFAIGSRFVGEGNEGFQSSRVRRMGITTFSKMIHVLTRQRFYDVTSGLRVVNKRVIRLFAKRYPHDYAEIETLQHALRQRVRVVELPVHMLPRAHGESHITRWQSLYYVWKVGLVLLIGSLRPREPEEEEEI